jgi:hypothetical protein
MDEKYILDVCCGGRMMWFDKDNKNTIYCDIREVEKGTIQYCPNWECKPDIIADYRDLPFDNNSFNLIVWDIPHIIKSSTGIISKKYGSLGENWKEDTKKAFNSIWSKLANKGVLIFKYNDIDIPVTDMLKLFPVKALFGTRTKKAVNSTYFIVFMKVE